MIKNKLYTMLNFILEMNLLGTKEFCELFGLPIPTMQESISESAKQFMVVDAQRGKAIVEYAKFLATPITPEVLINELGFIETTVERRSIIRYFEKKSRYTIKIDQYGFWREAYDSVDGKRVYTVEDLTDLHLQHSRKLVY